MKKLQLFLSLCLMAVAAQAQHDNLINLSAEWVRTPARNAATDAGDIVVYNPAGLVKLNDGFHINIGNQSLFRKPTHTFDMGMGMGEQTYTQDGNDPFLPNLYMSYKKDKFSLFTGMFMAGGGATANYPTGSFNTELIGLQTLMATQGAYGAYTNQYMKASSYYLTTTLGAAFAANDRISFSFAGRYISATNKTSAGLTLTQSPMSLPDETMELKTSEAATGFGGVFAMMVQANPRTRFTVRYETAVKLDFETNQETDEFGITQDGSKSRRDLPSTLAIGLAVAPSTKTQVYADFNYYLQTGANWGTSTMATDEKNYSELAGNALSVNIATTVQAGTKLMLSIGCGYTDFQYNDRDGYFTKAGAFETVPNDNYNINTGFSYRISNSLTGTFGYMHTFYQSADVTAVLAQPMEITIKTKNSLDAVALGIDLKF